MFEFKREEIEKWALEFAWHTEHHHRTVRCVSWFLPAAAAYC
jgi:hypothetical protein